MTGKWPFEVRLVPQRELYPFSFRGEGHFVSAFLGGIFSWRDMVFGASLKSKFSAFQSKLDLFPLCVRGDVWYSEIYLRKGRCRPWTRCFKRQVVNYFFFLRERLLAGGAHTTLSSENRVESYRNGISWNHEHEVVEVSCSKEFSRS